MYVMNADGGPQQQLTHNTVDDIVQDWQSLHDLRAPSVKALKSHGTLGKAITLHFKKAFDNSGRASVALTIFLGKRPVGYLRTPLKQRSAGHTYTATWRSYKLKGQPRFARRPTIRPATKVPKAARPSSRPDSERSSSTFVTDSPSETGTLRGQTPKCDAGVPGLSRKLGSRLLRLRRSKVPRRCGEADVLACRTHGRPSDRTESRHARGSRPSPPPS